MAEPNAASGASSATSGASGKDAVRGKSGEVTVYLASDRGRRMTWMLCGCAIGGLLLIKFGTVAAGIGAVLLAIGLYHTWFFVQTLLHEPGTVTVDGKQVSLPRGLCRGEPDRIAASALSAAYFLRHAVPWNKSAPVLVIEAGERAFALPRDWFASEADQRRIMHAVLPLVATNAAGAAGDAKSDDRATGAGDDAAPKSAAAE
jgi:hypothetical protein